MIIRTLALLISISTANAQALDSSFLIFSSQAACLTRSQAMCAAMGCDGVLTKYWWGCVPLNAGSVGPTAVLAGSYALEVKNSGLYGPQGLTGPEQSAEKSASAIAPVIPVIVSPLQ